MKKNLAMILAGVILSSALVGCSGTSKNTNNDSEGSKKEKVKITLKQSKVEIQESLENIANKFNDSQDEVEVQVLGATKDTTSQLQTQFAADPSQAPTIFTMAKGSDGERFQKYMASIESSKAAEKILPGFEEGAVVDGKLYGLPFSIEGIGLVYNKEIFTKAGINTEDITSIDALVEACDKLQEVEGVKSPLAFAKETSFIYKHLFNWAFATMDDYEIAIEKLNKKETTLGELQEVNDFIKAVKMLKPYTNLAKDSYDEQIAGFAAGAYPIIHQGNWAQKVLDDYEIDFEYGMIPFPLKGNDSIAVSVNSYFRINKYASEEEQQAAIKFLDWLFADEQGIKSEVTNFNLIFPYEGISTEGIGILAAEMSRYANEGKIVPWAFRLFPAGTHKDFADAMEMYYADKLTSEQLLETFDKIWKSVQ